jgi:NADPH-dependent curcumin reductase CurA
MIQELKVEGFLVSTRWADRWQEGIQAMATWIQASTLLLFVFYY